MPVDGDPKHATRATRSAGRRMRSLLLDGASRLFRERGLAGTSISDIAAAANAFPSQITYYFRTKEALFVEAACRELWEEVGTTKALLLRESPRWITYDVPEALRPAHWKGRWHGQAQKWFALAFTGHDADIDIAAHDQEFDAWQWQAAADMLDHIVPFKRPVYEAVLKEFDDLVK